MATMSEWLPGRIKKPENRGHKALYTSVVFTLEIIITGKRIRKENLQVDRTVFQKSCNLSQLRAGLYFIRLSSGKASRVKRLLIDR